jgi:dTDP-4-dehydrorhamnose 3,5-epimerase
VKQNIDYKGEMLDGIKVINNYKYLDNRGHFIEMWNSGYTMRGNFRQLNVASSKFGVLRGLHYQNQTKFVMPVMGKIFDVVLEPETGKWFGIELNECKALLIPPQYAHGYMVLSEQAIVQYIVDAPYEPSQEKIFRWDNYKIDWPLTITPILSQKDLENIFGVLK